MYYDFRCDACNAVFEIRRPISEAGDSAHCAVCGATAKRIYSGFPIIWRPDGWNLRPDEPGYSTNLYKEERPSCEQS